MRRPELAGRPPVTRLGRVRRRLGFDCNELRRRVDRVQWGVGLTLFVVFLVIAPIAATWTALWSHDSGTRIEHHERAARHQVVATVTGPGGLGTGGSDRYLHQTVQASWPIPGGGTRTGQIPAWKDAKAGARHKIWVDRTGKLTTRPRPHSRTVVDTGYAATGAVLAIGFPLLCAYGLVRRRCNRRRYADWDAEWARIDQPRV
jgi:hypothetical protein